MAGLGITGPVPNRSDDLARPRSRKGGDRTEITRGELRPVTVPDPDPDWHPIAIALWESLLTSGQADFYQDSDWAFAFSLMDDLSLYKQSTRRSAQMLQVINSSMERLLVTEGDRRRVRIELSAPVPDEDEATVAVMADYRQGLQLVTTEEPE